MITSTYEPVVHPLVLGSGCLRLPIEGHLMGLETDNEKNISQFSSVIFVLLTLTITRYGPPFFVGSGVTKSSHTSLVPRLISIKSLGTRLHPHMIMVHEILTKIKNKNVTFA